MKPLFRRGAPLGQHLLVNPHVAQTIAETSGAAPGATILEVGPGKGALTEKLLARGATVVAVEKDPAMVHALQETFQKEIAERRLLLIEGDARDFLSQDFSKLGILGEYAVAANIPYYITGELIRLFLSLERQPNAIVLLVQKEVAERIARSKKESLLSLSVKAYGEPEYIQTVRAGNFNPPPKVDSAILAISQISQKNFADISEDDFFTLLHAGFGQKRKTLLGNLKRSALVNDSHSLEALWNVLGFSPTLRAEDMNLSAWITLTKHIFKN